jgi:hypothetical protein
MRGRGPRARRLPYRQNDPGERTPERTPGPETKKPAIREHP